MVGRGRSQDPQVLLLGLGAVTEVMLVALWVGLHQERQQAVSLGDGSALAAPRSAGSGAATGSNSVFGRRQSVLAVAVGVGLCRAFGVGAQGNLRTNSALPENFGCGRRQNLCRIFVFQHMVAWERQREQAAAQAAAETRAFSPWAASQVQGGRGLPLRRICFCERGSRAVVAPWGQNPVLDRWGLGSDCPAPLPTAVLKPRWGVSPAASMSRSLHLKCI